LYYVNTFLINSFALNIFVFHGKDSKKRKPRGNLKGWTTTKKRSREASQKLSIQFSKIEGPVGANKRTFIDEIILFTRKRAPLIGVRTWRDIHVDVRIAIANDVLVSLCYPCGCQNCNTKKIV
jgi:hypothetical protein